MIYTLKRFEFSAARQLAGGRWTGHNFSGWAGVTGELNPDTGMFINVADLKVVLNGVLDRYDHRTLNTQLDAEPNTLNVARELWRDVAARLPAGSQLTSMELQEEGGDGARISGEDADRIAYGEFSAAHRTHAPRLSARENRALYGKCNNPAGHGHNYRAEVYLPPAAAFYPAVWAEFDHVNLSTDIPELFGRNVVTETLAELIARRVPDARRVRVWETPDFYAEYRAGDERYRLGRRYRFNAAHRLHSPALSAAANAALYGKCNRPDPHGHTYQVLVAIAAPLDPLTEAAFDIGCLDEHAAEVLGALDHRYLDREVAAFKDVPTTGENIAAQIYAQFQERLPDQLEMVQLWETPNNQFIVTGQD